MISRRPTGISQRWLDVGTAYLYAVLLVGVGMFVWRLAYIPMVNAALAVATFWLGMVPGYVYLISSRRPPLPLLALAGIYYAVFFGLTAFFFSGEAYGRRIVQTNTEAQLMVFGGLAVMLAGFYAVRRWFENTLPGLKLPQSYTTGRLKLLLWPMVAANFAWHLVPEIQAIPSIGQFIQPTGPLAIGMLVLLWRRGEMGWWGGGVLFVVLVAYFVRIVASGLLTELILLCGFLMVIMFHTRARMFWLWGVIPVVVLILAYPAISQFRSEVWFGAQAKLNMIERAALMAKLVARSWMKDTHKDYRWDFSVVLVRTSHGSLFSYVVERTPEKVPYLNGASYRPLFTSFVPRMVWPGKPLERFGNIFGIRYNILTASDSGTSINVPWIIEMFANFGRVGVMAGMALAGMFLAALSAIFNRRDMSDLEFVTGAAIIFPLAYPDSNFSLMTGSLLPLALCLWIYFRFGLTFGTAGRADTNLQ